MNRAHSFLLNPRSLAAELSGRFVTLQVTSWLAHRKKCNTDCCANTTYVPRHTTRA